MVDQKLIKILKKISALLMIKGEMNLKQTHTPMLQIILLMRILMFMNFIKPENYQK